MKYKICFFDNCVLHYAYEKYMCQKEYTDYDSAYFDWKVLSKKYMGIEFFVLEEKA